MVNLIQITKNSLMKRFLLSVFVSSFSLLFSQEKSRAEEYLSSLSKIEQVSQVFLVNVEGNVKYKAVEFYKGKPVIPGGILLFSYNIGHSKEQVKNYIQSIKNYSKENKISVPYIAIDQEGGYVNRLRGITSVLVSNEKIKNNFAPSAAFDVYKTQAEEMKELGINLNLAPVVEPLLESNKKFLESRSYGEIEKACVYSVLCINAYEKKGIGTTAKHFPGNTNTDPHTGLPEIRLSENEIARDMILPFAFVLSVKPSAVLMSHARVKNADDIPSCFSKYWIKDVLQQKMGFEGLVISDDVFMGALADNGYPPETACVKAIEAGVDVLMLSEKKFLPVALQILDEAEKNPEFAKRLHEAELKVIEFKIKKGVLN